MRLEQVRVAGGCNPLVPCTAALVGGLTALETYKCAAKAPLERYRNSFVNLAIPTLVSDQLHTTRADPSLCVSNDNLKLAWNLKRCYTVEPLCAYVSFLL